MPDNICPLCGGDKCRITVGEAQNCKDYYCDTYERRFKIHITVLNSKEKEKIYYLITEFLLDKNCLDFNGQDCDYIFYCQETSDDYGPQYINMYDLIPNFPTGFMDKANRALVNLSIIYPEYGYVFYKSPLVYRAIFDEEEQTPGYYLGGMYELLADLGYLTQHKNSSNYSITAEGWKKIDEFRKMKKEFNQGFIAMAFKEETRSIREAFRTAIKNSGYAASIIDEKEHNNQIVPEIFYEIERSKFVVVDVTFPNYGAYYEAGYAQALGKQVIMCCRKAEFDSDGGRPHFDVAQKSMIVWENEGELVERLKKRIEATVK